MLDDKKIPDIFLGALLAVMIFAFGFSVALSLYPPNQNSGAQPADQKGGAIGGDDRLAKYTLALDWLNGFLVISTLLLWRANRRSAKISERALTQLERPFIGIKIEKTGLMNLREGTDHKDLIFRLVNYGRAPAIITQLFDDIVTCQCGNMPNPCDITTDENEIPTGFVIGADKEAYQPSTRTYGEMFSDVGLRAFTMGTDDVFFIGFVRYRDIGNRKYRTGFCMKWSVPGDKEGSFPFLFIGEDGYNYTREET